ncbi:MAG: tetrathionate reductase family octaheme c-type cytochrome [Desulfosalsimonadaceae bacterium]
MVPYVDTIIDECLLCRQQKLRDKGLGIKDIPNEYFLLDSPIINKQEDYYGPVRFMHANHAASAKDCAVCHHYRPAAPDALETTRCSACHQDAFNKTHPERIGLKAAYHLQCVECHKTRNKGPVDCIGCHMKNVPDHNTLVKLPEKPTPQQVTAECLRCHRSAGEDLLTTAHWLWKGPSPYTMERRKNNQHGKGTDVFNNYCISLITNEARCTSCHAGYGWKDTHFDFNDMNKMDCLVCHDTTGTYQKSPKEAGMPDPAVDLLKVAKNVGHTSRQTCGSCHFSGGGGDGVKHSDLSSELLHPSRNCDIHMGGYDFQCVACHRTRNHQIAGRSNSVPVVEGARSCKNCHADKPHYRDNLLSHHLNKHCETIDCNTCHSPVYAKCKPTKVWWDWSKAGDKNRIVKKDKYGMPDYAWEKGEFAWAESPKPEYAWYNGFVKRILLGDKVDMNQPVVHITEPVGSIKDPNSRITPFKIMKGVQGFDAKYQYALAPHLFPRNKEDKTAYWKNLDWQKAFTDGMAVAGIPYSGEYKWVETWMYWRVEHEVMPASMALSCVQCHESLKKEKTCNRCHQDNRDIDFNKLAHKGTDFSFMASQGRDVSHLIDSTDYINFKALGYKGDPIISGGRFKKLPLGGKE